MTVEMDASPGSVVIALLAMLFAGLATIRRAWARIVFGIPAVLAGGLLVSARLTDMEEVRDYGLEIGSGLWFGLAAGRPSRSEACSASRVWRPFRRR